VHTHTHTHTHTHIPTCIYTHMHTDTHRHTQTNTQPSPNTNMHLHTHAHRHTQTHTDTHRQTRNPPPITHTHTHTHMNTRRTIDTEEKSVTCCTHVHIHTHKHMFLSEHRVHAAFLCSFSNCTQLHLFSLISSLSFKSRASRACSPPSGALLESSSFFSSPPRCIRLFVLDLFLSTSRSLQYSVTVAFYTVFVTLIFHMLCVVSHCVV